MHGRDLSGKLAIVTGANTGIGFETARSLAKHGCAVVLACRDPQAAEDAVERVRAEKSAAGALCAALPLDLASLESVRNFARTIGASHRKVDMLILNAGVFGLPFTTTRDGYETTFQVNHLAQFYLVLLLRPLLVTGSRVVFVSSESHR